MLVKKKCVVGIWEKLAEVLLDVGTSTWSWVFILESHIFFSQDVSNRVDFGKPGRPNLVASTFF